MTELIKATNVSKVFHDGDQKLQIFKKINFNLIAGEKIAILGVSGSGKSTLLHILAGLDKATTGEIFIDGFNLHKQSENMLAKLRNQKLGFIYQFHHLLPEFSALENIAMPLLIRGDNFRKSLDLAFEYLKKIGLADRAEHKPAKLSGGERQRVAIARAMITKPVCILADEPTGNLDEGNALKVFKLLLDLNNESNTSLVLVTHDMALARQLDKVYALNHGSIALI